MSCIVRRLVHVPTVWNKLYGLNGISDQLLLQKNLRTILILPEHASISFENLFDKPPMASFQIINSTAGPSKRSRLRLYRNCLD